MTTGDHPGRAHVVRVEVRTRPGLKDPRADSLRRRASDLGLHLGSVHPAKVYLIEGPLSGEQVQRVVTSLLADPVVEYAVVGAEPPPAGSVVIEVHPLPGVMDPAAQSVRDAIRELTGTPVHVSTGSRYDVAGLDARQARELALKALANPAIHQIVDHSWTPDALPQGSPYTLTLRRIPLVGLTDQQLATLSREAHLFLSLEEMKAIQTYFRDAGREPTDIELETLAQTWSEHCVHKTLKSTVRYTEAAPPSPSPAPVRHPESPRVETGFSFTPTGSKEDAPREGGFFPAPVQPGTPKGLCFDGRPGHERNPDGSVTIHNLLRSTVAAATHELVADGVDWTISVFKDNSGVVEYDDELGVCIKVETHNRPSAIEPYGGAATGIGGCIRDVIGTGLGAKPIASTDVFCVADPTRPESSLPPGCLHPRRILTEVVAGVRDYGNRMGIPTINGAVFFDDRYVGNPLVFCGCVGLIPRDLAFGKAQPGDRIIALGGRTGRDGIHGATFSSAEVGQGHSTEFAHAVQIGNAIEEKRLLDAILRARGAGGDGRPLYHAITDCGAGGFSSAVGEMGSSLGAQVDLEKAPLKYAGLSYTEVWISEAQERMVLAVPPENVGPLRVICAEESVELADLGHFGTEGAELVLRYAGAEVGRLSMRFVHDGIPTPTREARWATPARPAQPNPGAGPSSVGDALVRLLSHPTIASKHWIVRQYDHEVQGQSVLKPLVGPGGRGPGDASVIEPRPGSGRGIALACGLQTGLGDATLAGEYADPYQAALGAIDECVRNLVCVGADHRRIAILDNFCWPSCEKPENLGALVRACEGCYDGAKAYRTPFVSGKDSLNNQLRYADPRTGEQKVIEIPPTLLITGLAQVPSVARCVSMDAKSPSNMLLLVGRTTGEMGGSMFQRLFPSHRLFSDADARAIPRVDLAAGPSTAGAIAQLIRDGLVRSAHDCSDAGVLACVAEMLIATTVPSTGSVSGDLASLLAGSPVRPALGAELSLADDVLEVEQLAFAETPSRYVLEIRPEDLVAVRTVLRDFGGIFATPIGRLNGSSRLVWQKADLNIDVRELADAWLHPLDW